jgi:glycosyltransferase involved in cell wall biosynthesis
MSVPKHHLTISIVIPVYNEAAHLADCLQSIALQSHTPDEVFVVDNNSSDSSVAIARQFAFVTVLTASVQGTIAARDCGFNAATSDIIGRIDGDIVLPPTWVETVLQNFNVDAIDGLTGPLESDAIPGISRIPTTIWSRLYLLSVRAFFRIPVMLGGNMAITRKAWYEICGDAQKDSALVHEDQDLSVLMAANGLRVRYSRKLTARIAADALQYFEWPKFKEYYDRRSVTRSLHRNKRTLRNSRAIRLPMLTWLPVRLVTRCSTFFALAASWLVYQYRK